MCSTSTPTPFALHTHCGSEQVDPSKDWACAVPLPPPGWGSCRGLQVGWHKFATRIRACTEFSIQNPHQKYVHARNFVANLCQPTCKPLWQVDTSKDWACAVLPPLLHCTPIGEAIFPYQISLLFAVSIISSKTWLMKKQCPRKAVPFVLAPKG